MLEKKYKHFLSISYAREDEELVEEFANEFRSIFEDVMFFDKDKAYIFASAEPFKPVLEDIFTDSQYVVVFSSKDYYKKPFSLTELKAVKARTEAGEKDFWFNVKIGTFKIKDPNIAEPFHHSCPENYSKVTKVTIRDIVDKIKKSIIMREIELKPDDDFATLNLQTMFQNNNPAIWMGDYDWNIIAQKYVKEDGRKLAEEYRWSDLWKYVCGNYSFFRNQIKHKYKEKTKWRIRLNCHLSIAYALGSAYGEIHQSELYRRIELISSYPGNKYSFFGATPIEPKELNLTVTQNSEVETTSGEGLVCVVEALGRQADSNIISKVNKVLAAEMVSYQKLVHVKLENKFIQTAGEFYGIAERIANTIQKERSPEMVVHLFLNAPAILAFVLAGYKKYMGTVQLYDYLPAEGYVKSLDTNQIEGCAV